MNIYSKISQQFCSLHWQNILFYTAIYYVESAVSVIGELNKICTKLCVDKSNQSPWKVFVRAGIRAWRLDKEFEQIKDANDPH